MIPKPGFGHNHKYRNKAKRRVETIEGPGGLPLVKRRRSRTIGVETHRKARGEVSLPNGSCSTPRLAQGTLQCCILLRLPVFLHCVAGFEARERLETSWRLILWNRDILPPHPTKVPGEGTRRENCWLLLSGRFRTGDKRLVLVFSASAPFLLENPSCTTFLVLNVVCQTRGLTVLSVNEQQCTKS
ncbi:uncharacterized protein LOC135093759 isoform X2 [Scylla paramamosain]|uniref:uncharacterized protein LOC135093759 isoform X2 n=1 Tax=Scylla paramamosain TaxID=85552 RepID=UPI0030830B0E